MYIKTSFFIININPLIKKILNHQCPYRKYWFNIVDDKKDLKIWWDSPFKVRPRDKVQVDVMLNEVKAHMTETKVQYHMTILNTSDVI